MLQTALTDNRRLATDNYKKIKRPDLPVELTANQRRLAVGVGAFFSCIHKGEVLNYLKNILPICGVLLLLFVVSTGSVFAFSAGPPDEKTGAPNEDTCAQANCHAGNDLNVSGGSLMLTIPETYIPSEVYTIVVDLSRAGQSRWGFEMTALDANGARAGSFLLLTPLGIHNYRKQIVNSTLNTLLLERLKGQMMHTVGNLSGLPPMRIWGR